MKHLVEYILESSLFENLLSKDSWAHKNKYDYIKKILDVLLDTPDGCIHLGKDGKGVDGLNDIDKSYFDVEKLKQLQDDLNNSNYPETYKAFNDCVKPEYKKVVKWTNIYKGDFSGFAQSGKPKYIHIGMLTPLSFGLATNKEFTYTELNNHVNRKLNSIFSKLSDKELNKKYIDFIKHIISAIDSFSPSKQISVEEFISMDDDTKANLLASIPLENASEYNDLDSINVIATELGEILSSLYVCKIISDNITIAFPKDHSNPIVDFYVCKNGIQTGVSVKHGSGHRSEVSIFAPYIIVNTPKFDKNNKDIFVFINEVLPMFFKQNTFDIRKNVYTREVQLWNLANLLYNDIADNEDNVYKAIMEYKNYITDNNAIKNIDSMLAQKQYTTGKIIKFAIDSMSDDKYKEYLSNVIEKFKIKNIGKGKTVDLNKTTISNINYSKVAHALQYDIVRILNERFVDNNNALTSIINTINKALQIHIDIDPKRVKFNFKNLGNADYRFSCAGATWNEWKSHIFIGIEAK